MKLAPLLAALILAAPVAAQDRELCSDRPGLGAPPCIVDKGRVLVETGLASWTRNRDAGVQVDAIAIADSFVRIGVTDTVEAQVGWTPYARQRLRDRAVGGSVTSDGVGDVLLGFKANLANPDGSGFSISVQPGVTLPVGSDGIGAGDWSAALLVPLSYDLAGLSLQATPQVYAATDADGSGRHFAWGSVVGLGFDLGGSVGAGLEVLVLRDDDPLGATTQAFAGLSAAWQPSKDWQIDAGANIGLNRASDELELYFGFSRRF